MPQLDQITLVYASQLFWLGIVLAFIYFVIGRTMLPKVESTMTDRDAKISGDLAAATQAQHDAEGMEETWRKQMADAHASAQAVIATTKNKAAAKTSDAVNKADAKLTAQLEAAQADIAKAQADALAHVSEIAAESAQSVAAKVAGLNVTSAAALKAAKEVMAHG
jgi:F-type H+-transporting ATPase subunit b